MLLYYFNNILYHLLYVVAMPFMQFVIAAPFASVTDIAPVMGLERFVAILAGVARWCRVQGFNKICK